MLRAPYQKGLPFLTVMGNRDIRGKGAGEEGLVVELVKERVIRLGCDLL